MVKQICRVPPYKKGTVFRFMGFIQNGGLQKQKTKQQSNSTSR